MSNTVNINYASRTINHYTKVFSNYLKEQDNALSMKDSINKVITERSFRSNAISGQDISLEEYKKYIFDKITSFKISDTRMNDLYSISISDSGFESMKNDTEYENWVLDYIRKDMAHDAFIRNSSSYCILSFGASKEEFSGNIFPMESKNSINKKKFDLHSADSFWTNRAKKQKKYFKLVQKKVTERKKLDKMLDEKAAVKKRQYDLFLNGFTDKQILLPTKSVISSYESCLSILSDL